MILRKSQNMHALDYLLFEKVLFNNAIINLEDNHLSGTLFKLNIEFLLCHITSSVLLKSELPHVACILKYKEKQLKCKIKIKKNSESI